MKNSIILSLLIAVVSISHAQENRYLVAYTNVQYYIESKKTDTDVLLKALEAINTTVLNEKMMLKGKTFYYQGLINQLVYENKEIGGQQPDALFKASNAYQTALTVDDAKFKEVKQSKGNLVNIALQLYNDGVGLYERTDFDNAFRYFNEVKSIKLFLDKHAIETKQPIEEICNNSIFNGALCLDRLGKTEEAKILFQELIEMQYDNPSIYQKLASYSSEAEEYEQALAILAQGLEIYPTESSIMVDELNIYLKLDRATEAIDKMERAAAIDSTNSMLFFAMGDALDKIDMHEKAEKAYLKAIKLDPNYHDAYNNLGAIFFNKGVEINQELADNMNLSDSEYAALTKKRDGLYEKSLPYFEKAYAIKNDDLSILNALKVIYARLGMYDKSKEMKTKIASLK